MTYKIAHNHPCTIGEGPLWWNHKLWFVDGYELAVRTVRPETGEEKDYIVGSAVTSLNPMSNGKLLLTRLDGLFDVFDEATGEVTPFSFDKRDLILHFNDSKVGPDGCLYVGNRRDKPGVENEINPDAGLYRLSPDGSFVRVAADFLGINGLDWSPDGKILYVVDSSAATLRVFGFGDTLTEMGSIHIEGHADGMTVDTEGYPICALWAPRKIVRIDPESGNTIEAYQLPCRVSSCAFGGDSFDRLYVTTPTYNKATIEEYDGRTLELDIGHLGKAPYIFGKT